MTTDVFIKTNDFAQPHDRCLICIENIGRWHTEKHKLSYVGIIYNPVPLRITQNLLSY